MVTQVYVVSNYMFATCIKLKIWPEKCCVLDWIHERGCRSTADARVCMKMVISKMN